MDPIIIGALISAVATVIAALIPRVRLLFSVPPLALGAFVTGVVVLVGLAVQLEGINVNLNQVKEGMTTIDQRLGDIDERFDQNPTIADLPEEPPAPAADESDRHARAILDGAGPEEWRMPDGRTIHRGDVLYSRGGGFFPLVFPRNERNDRVGFCVLEEQARLTIKGFSIERTAALIEYAAPPGRAEEDDGGFGCENGSFFFYPAPLVSQETPDSRP